MNENMDLIDEAIHEIEERKPGMGDLPAPSDSTPLMDGTGSAGSSADYARGNHRHPTDTSRAPINHRSTGTSYGMGNGSYYGHVKLSDATDSSSGVSSGVAATPKAVQTVKDALGTFDRPNLLDDAFFVGGGSQQGGGQLPINLRLQTSYDDIGYCVDRWCSPVTSPAVSLANSGYLSAHSIFQRVENQDSLLDKPLTFSVLFYDGTLLTGTKILTSFSVNTYFAEHPITGGQLSLLYNSYWRGFQIDCTVSGESMKLVAAKLELGDNQTLVHQDANGNWLLNEIPNFQATLDRCLHYQRVIFNSSDRIRASQIGRSDMHFFIPISSPMRITPTLINPNYFCVYSIDGVQQTGFTFDIAGYSLEGILIIASKTNHGLTDGFLMASNSPIIIDANL